MKSGATTYRLRKLLQRFRFIRIAESLAWAIAAAGLAYGLASVIRFQPILGSMGIGVTIFTMLAFRKRVFRSNGRQIISFLNANYPELEESADLLVADETSLSPLQQLQQYKVRSKFESIVPNIKFPHRLGRASILLVLSWILSGFLLTQVAGEQKQTSKALAEPKQTSVAITKVPAGVKSAKITITPPDYTAIRPYDSESHDLRVPEGSRVTWNYTFDKSIDAAALKIAPKDSFALKQTENSFSFSYNITRSSIYQLLWNDNAGPHFSDFHRIEVIADKAPDIKIVDLPQSFDLTFKDKLEVSVKANINDDYQLVDSYIIATVAKGSGESVKFREEKLLFASPKKIAGKQVTAYRTIDLKKLGLEPGDEIYFYAEALDNKRPAANKARTETFFVTLLDTAQQDIMADAGLGVDLMPEYFRSQRQIIIDTEKLIRNKRGLEKQLFNATSNELGYDQKVLRLKYGEFLGEEFESELAPSDEMETEVNDLVGQEEAEDVTEKFGHAHDKENEHNLVEEKKPGAAHDHGHDEEQKDPEAKEDPLKDFVHAHDDPEEATFFLQSIRTKLKAALTEMWDAELYLRLYQPEKSLPYQYKALRLLKEVSNDSRIYVHKTGFDPPPLKEEKRLTGDLAEIKSNSARFDRMKKPTSAAIRKAASLLEQKNQANNFSLSSEDKTLLAEAGNELASLAIGQPDEYLSSLSLLRRLLNSSESVANEETIRTIMKAFWKALPQEQHTGKQSSLRHPIDESFVKQLEQSNHD